MPFLYIIILYLIIKLRMKRDRNFFGQNFPCTAFSGTELSWTDFSLYRIVLGHNSPGQNLHIQNFLGQNFPWTEF